MESARYEICSSVRARSFTARTKHSNLPVHDSFPLDRKLQVVDTIFFSASIALLSAQSMFTQTPPVKDENTKWLEVSFVLQVLGVV